MFFSIYLIKNDFIVHYMIMNKSTDLLNGISRRT